MIYKIIYLHILLDNIPHHYCTNKIQNKVWYLWCLMQLFLFIYFIWKREKIAQLSKTVSLTFLSRMWPTSIDLQVHLVCVSLFFYRVKLKYNFFLILLTEVAQYYKSEPQNQQHFQRHSMVAILHSHKPVESKVYNKMIPQYDVLRTYRAYTLSSRYAG